MKIMGTWLNTNGTGDYFISQEGDTFIYSHTEETSLFRCTNNRGFPFVSQDDLQEETIELEDLHLSAI